MIALPVVSFPLLYAETHYRFKYFFSFLKKAEPEILADIPHRLEPSASLPVLLLVKDSNRYPIELSNAKIEIRQEGKLLYADTIAVSCKIAIPLWWKIISIPFDDQLKNIFGFINVDVYFDYVVRGEHRSAKNDNYRTSSKTSLRVYRSADPLPLFVGWNQGDTHTHSSYTDDQVEFGSPIEASVELSKAMGLSFFCVTDHSYDLDDCIDNFLVNDPEIPKWRSQQQNIDEINSQHNDFTIVRGEEVSCSNHAQRNVHLLLWGTKKFFAGSGDSAERWFRTASENTIGDILSNKEDHVVAYAGHPTEATPFFQWLLIKRGTWDFNDMDQNGLAGLQVLNGDANQAFSKGLESWTRLLLRGRKIFIAAGNDAHGNFNRFKQIGIPFFTIRENGRQLFGKMRTAVNSDSLTETSLLEALRDGHTVITNGPLIVFTITNESGKTAAIGETISGARLQLHIRGLTTKEFGAFCELKIIFGRIGTGSEVVRMKKQILNLFTLDMRIDFEVCTYQVSSYIRIEGFASHSADGGTSGFCYTNPIWIRHS
ncbi:MAG: CehA/McbA family metallohydrolase [Bacteroidota bacterium]